ncbi:MAG: Inner membrane symporter YicJ [Syntrophomonadaceae bacterium]|nr:Inner membrane symporter YicJ [Bacillota bacterium]
MSKNLPTSGKLLYAASSAGWAMLDRLVVTWLMFFYVEGAVPLMLPAAFGAILVFGRVIDALADPLVGFWSDNCRSALGRRTPFLLAGGIAYVLAFVALFHPPAPAHGLLNMVYLLILTAAYFFLFTVYVCPYLALMPELVRTAYDRVDLATLRAVFSLLGVAAALVGSGPLISRLGFQGMIWSLAAVGLLLMYLPLFVREKKYAEARPSTLGLRESVATTLRNRAFRIYLAGNATFWFGFNIITLALPFYVTVLLGMPKEAVSAFFAATFGVAFLAFPVVNLLVKKVGHKKVMLASFAQFVVILPLFYFLGQPLFGLEPVAFAYLVLALAGLPLSSLFVLPDAILSSITDLEEDLSGQRREAMYFGTQGLVLKTLLGVSTFTTGLLFQIFGSTVAEPLGVRLTPLVAVLFVLAGGLIFLFYPEKEVRAKEQSSALRAKGTAPL